MSTKEAPLIPDGMPEGTEWWKVVLLKPGQGFVEPEWGLEEPDTGDEMTWHGGVGCGLTALAFLMPDGEWHIEWACLKPVQWNYQTAHGHTRWETHDRPGPAPNDYIATARLALMVPPKESE